jgi:hypothetical protein
MQTDIGDGGLLAQAAALAGATVAIVKHSGRRGTHQEFSALVKGLEEAAAHYRNNIYVQSLLTPDTRKQIAAFAERYDEVPKQTVVNDFKMAALNRCAQAADWMDAHVPPPAAGEVKSSILVVCRRVAAESKEGGPFNFVASNVDAFEESVIGEIARALRAA